MANISVFEQFLTTKDGRDLETEILSYGVSFKDFCPEPTGNLVDYRHPWGPQLKQQFPTEVHFVELQLEKKTQTKGGGVLSYNYRQE